MSFLSIVVVLLSVVQGSTQADLEAVKHIEQRFTTTLLKKDADAFANLLSPDIVHIGFEGKRAGRAEYLTFFKVESWQYKKYEPSNVAIKLIGNVAIVTGRVDRTIVINSEETSGAFAFTHVWWKGGSQWTLTSSQLTNIPPEQ
jgi:ketosteroid isomerase-like protein